MMILKNPSHAVAIPSGGFPTPSIVDSFTRADAASLGSNYGRLWNGDADLRIISNRAGGNAANYFDNYYNVAQYLNPDVACTMSVLPDNTGRIYLTSRIQSPGTGAMSCYQLVYANDGGTLSIRLDRVDSEVENTINSWNQTLSAGNGYGMRVTGTGATVTIAIYINTGSGWTLFQTETDTDVNRITTTGYAGLGVYRATARIDDFIAGNS